MTTIYIQDTFTGSDGTNLVDHTPDTGGAWSMDFSADPEGLQIYSNQLRMPTYDEDPSHSSGTYIAANAAAIGALPLTVTYTLTFHANESASWQINRYGDNPGNTDHLVLIDFQNTSTAADFFGIDGDSATHLFDTLDTAYSIRHELTDTSQQIYVDDVLVLDQTLTPGWFEGPIGIGLYNSGGGSAVIRVDNLLVQSYEAPTVTVYLAPTFGAGYQAFSSGGEPLNSGKLHTYITGGTTPQATWTSSAGDTENTNPIIFGVDGRPPNEIWLEESVAYRFVLTDSDDNVIATYDSLPGINDPAQFTTSYIAVDNGSAAAPSVRVGAANTGLFRATGGGGDLGVTVNGNEVARFVDSSGFEVTGDISATGDITATGEVTAATATIGTLSSTAATVADINVTGKIQVDGASGTTAQYIGFDGSGNAVLNTLPTVDTSTVGDSIATLTAADVGSMVYALNFTAGTLQYGGTTSGANIQPSNSNNDVGSYGALPGTWKCLGYSAVGYSTLFVRIS